MVLPWSVNGVILKHGDPSNQTSDSSESVDSDLDLGHGD
ncbi:hypothetical protein T07_15248 [Trichinella nelsoni]|uniref:Uncharacterized protein n=1 Tax=Trichinella nelsoni TaxID=6336 RepID=A0A0V0RB98_9BILA|nr:hypothetical protein T07_15248 [Trichinella nelsoni]